MKVIRQLNDWYPLRDSFKEQGYSYGFVPTMGHLHDGHMSLIKRSSEENDLTIISIFVNPTQFNSVDDWAHYPNSLDEDLAMCEHAGVDVVLFPCRDDVYADQYRFQMSETKESRLMEGAHRPGHFTGVLTIVLKLLLLTQAKRVYMGEKDYQQYELVRDMVKALFIDCEIIACPTVRESSGLAMSSRNSRLNADQKQLSARLNQIIKKAKHCDDARLQLEMIGFEVDYVHDYHGRRYVAATIGSVRLIDNIVISESDVQTKRKESIYE